MPTLNSPYIQPTISPYSYATNGLMNLPQQQRQQGQQTESGIGIGDIYDLSKKAYDLGGRSILPSGVATAIDDFGYNVFGVGQKVAGPGLDALSGSSAASLPWATSAPAAEGVAGGLSTSFTPMNIGAGIAGGFAANKVFGGGVGTDVGSAAGGMIGSIGGPVGTLVGSFIGGGIGSLFGNKKPSNRQQVGGVDFNTGKYQKEASLAVSQSGEKFSPQNAGLRDAYANASADLIQYLRNSGAEQTEAMNQVVMLFGDRSGYEFFWEKPDMTPEEKDPNNRKTENFGKDLGAFGEGLSDSIMSKFNLTGEQMAEAKAVFNRSLQQAGPAGATQQNAAGPRVPLVGGRKNTTWDDYMQRKLELDAQAERTTAAPKIAPTQTESRTTKPILDDFGGGRGKSIAGDAVPV